MHPRQEPRQPSTWELQENGRAFPPNYLHESWRDYLYWDLRAGKLRLRARHARFAGWRLGGRVAVGGRVEPGHDAERLLWRVWLQERGVKLLPGGLVQAQGSLEIVIHRAVLALGGGEGGGQ